MPEVSMICEQQSVYVQSRRFINIIMTDSLLRWTVDKLKNSFGLEASDDIVQ